MKKIIAILISMLLFVSTNVFANETFPEELMLYPENFTAAYSISLSIDDNSDIRNLVEELAYADENMGSLIGADFLNFLSAMFDYDGTIDVQADVSSDYKRIKLSLTNSNILSSVVSSNKQFTSILLILVKTIIPISMDIKANKNPFISIFLIIAIIPNTTIITVIPTNALSLLAVINAIEQFTILIPANTFSLTLFATHK